MKHLFKTAEFKPVAQFTKEASGRRVSRESTQWSKEAIEYFYDQYPEFMGAQVFAQFRQKDAEKGYGIGSLRAGNYIVPILIREWNLSPYDIAISAEGTVVPFNREMFGLEQRGINPFEEVVTDPKKTRKLLSFDRALAYAASAPDEYGVKTSSVSILEKLAQDYSIYKADRDRIADVLKNDINTSNAYETHPIAMDVLSKVATYPVYENTDLNSKMSLRLDRDIHYLEKIGNFEYELTVGSSKYDDPVKITLTEKQARVLPSIQATPRPTIKMEKVAENQEAVAIPNQKGDGGLLLTKEGSYVNVVGREFNVTDVMNNKDTVETTMADIAAGKTGFFALHDEQNGVYKKASDIITIEKVAGTPISVRVTANNGINRTNFDLVKVNFEDLMAHETEKNAVYVPGNAVFVEVGKEMELGKIATSSPNYGMNKLVKVAQDSYAFRSTELEKYASRHELNPTDVSETDTIWALLQTGASKETIEKLSAAKPGDLIIVEEDLKLPEALSKTAQTIKDIDGLDEFEGTDYWVKLAAWAPNKESADHILSLNFLNKKTIDNFIEYIPYYEEMLQSLADLLLHSRVGLEQIEEQPIAEAIEALSRVVVLLYGAKNTRDMKTTKS